MDYRYINRANPYISGIRALKETLAAAGGITVNRDPRLREIRFLLGQSFLPESVRMKNVDKYVASLLDEDKVDTDVLIRVRDILTEVGFALEELKQTMPINQMPRDF